MTPNAETYKLVCQSDEAEEHLTHQSSFRFICRLIVVQRPVAFRNTSGILHTLPEQKVTEMRIVEMSMVLRKNFQLLQDGQQNIF